MPVFLSYSHANKDFVDKLATNLVAARVSVWLDRWEMNVGDSLIEKIQEGLQDASALLVILSKASIESSWCKKELSVGLLRELDERKVVVLPVLLEDCLIPLMLRDKVYADFRTNFDEGWHAVISAISGVTSLDMGRIAENNYYTDWSEDWGELQGQTIFNFNFAQASQQSKHTILTQIQIVATQESTRRFQGYVAAGLEWFGRFVILESIIEAAQKTDLRFILEDSFPRTQHVEVADQKSGLGYSVRLSARRLGEDTGKDILVDGFEMLKSIHTQVAGRIRKLTPSEAKKVSQIIAG